MPALTLTEQIVPVDVRVTEQGGDRVRWLGRPSGAIVTDA